MIYKSNLEAPDLSSRFAHLHSEPLSYSHGHEVPRDWSDKADDDPVFGIYKACGCWTHDERAILANVAAELQGAWLDIGAATGMTTVHVAGMAELVIAVEPMFASVEFYNRFALNTSYELGKGWILPWPGRSDQFFSLDLGLGKFDGVVIDGNHDAPNPLNDAIGSLARLKDRGAILFHDFKGAPVTDAAKYLVDNGMRFKIYYTPHMVCLCYRGDFTPPEHLRDPRVDWEKYGVLPEWVK